MPLVKILTDKVYIGKGNKAFRKNFDFATMAKENDFVKNRNRGM